MAGLILDPWQKLVLNGSLGERDDGQWAAFEVGETVPRQNGKGGTLEARELGGLYLFDERLLVHTAHLFDTSLEAFRRLLELIEGRDELTRRVKRISRSHGEEGIELYGPEGRRRTGGQRIRFRTRTKGGGRGFSGDLVILDEAMILQESSHRALLPTLSARPNPQIWYVGSAVDQEEHEHGLVFARIRARGVRGDDPSLAYFEWSPDVSLEDAQAEAVATDPKLWAQANPALGIRITTDYVRNEQRSMDPRGFAVERLNVGDWPRTDGIHDGGLTLELWRTLEDPLSAPGDPLCFAVDVTPDRAKAAIAVAGRRHDDLWHGEIVEHRRGTGWVAERAVELLRAHAGIALVLDAAGPAGALIPELTAAGLQVANPKEPRAGCIWPVTAREHAQACGRFYDLCDQGGLRHLGTGELETAIKGAIPRTLGDAWAWSRKSSSVDISPLVAITLALWGAAAIKLDTETWVSFG